jgi:hypothetical protein
MEGSTGTGSRDPNVAFEPSPAPGRVSTVSDSRTLPTTQTLPIAHNVRAIEKRGAPSAPDPERVGTPGPSGQGSFPLLSGVRTSEFAPETEVMPDKDIE